MKISCLPNAAESDIETISEALEFLGTSPILYKFKQEHMEYCMKKDEKGMEEKQEEQEQEFAWNNKKKAPSVYARDVKGRISSNPE